MLKEVILDIFHSNPQICERAIIGPIGKSFQRVRKGFQKVPTEHGGTLGTHIKTVFRPNLLTKPFFLLSSQKVDWIAADPTL